MPPERPASAVRRVGRAVPPPFFFAVQYHEPFHDRGGQGRMRKKVWLGRAAVAVAVAFAAFAFGWAPYYLAGIATSRRFQFPDRENGGLTPESFQLAYENVSLTSADGTKLEGWWVPAAAPKGTVIMVHGLNRSRIEMVRRV